jgi:hypothetical protein
LWQQAEGFGEGGGGAGQSSQMSPVTVIVANPCSRLAVPVIVVILLSW